MLNHFMKGAFVAMAILATGTTYAGSTSFSADEVERFISTMETLETRKAEFKNISDSEPENMNNMVASDGSMMFFRSLLSEIKQYPAEEKKLLKIFTDAGFKSTSHWATTGDKIMLAYMGHQMEMQNGAEHSAMEQMQQMTPEMLSMIPEDMRGMMEASMKMAKAVENISAADKAVLAPYLKRLDAITMEE